MCYTTARPTESARDQISYGNFTFHSSGFISSCGALADLGGGGGGGVLGLGLGLGLLVDGIVWWSDPDGRSAPPLSLSLVRRLLLTVEDEEEEEEEERNEEL